MITVLKHGRRNVFRGTCFGCGCEVECSENDALLDRDFTAPQMYLYCPECGGRINITSGVIYSNGCTTMTQADKIE